MIGLKEGKEATRLVATLQIMMLQGVMSRSGDCCCNESWCFPVSKTTKRTFGNGWAIIILRRAVWDKVLHFCQHWNYTVYNACIAEKLSRKRAQLTWLLFGCKQRQLFNRYCFYKVWLELGFLDVNFGCVQKFDFWNIT